MATSPTPSPRPRPPSTRPPDRPLDPLLTVANPPGWADPPATDPPTARTIPPTPPETPPGGPESPPTTTTGDQTAEPLDGGARGFAGEDGGPSTDRPPTSSRASTEHPADPALVVGALEGLIGTVTFGVHVATRSPGDRWIATDDERRTAAALLGSIAERHTDLAATEASDLFDGIGLAIVGAGYVARNVAVARAERAPRGVVAPEEAAASTVAGP